MKNQIVWVASPVVFSVIGMMSCYLCDPPSTILGTIGGLFAGLGVAAFAAAGGKNT